MAAFQTLDDAGDLHGKRALVRVDLNVPLSHEKGEDGKVTDDTRLQATKPTIDKLRAGGAKGSCWPTSTGPRARSCRR
jgi:phosphoglycerate kinase